LVTDEPTAAGADSVAVTGNDGVLITNQRTITPTNKPPTIIRPTCRVSAWLQKARDGLV
jgi:hypothetical protein